MRTAMRWAPIDREAGLYELEKVVESGWSWRALALRLADGELLLVSPIRGTTEPGRVSLEALGRPAFALAPNHFHHLGLSEVRAHYPELRCVSSKLAAPRLERTYEPAFAPLDALRERLPRGASLLEPPGLATGEVWLRMETGRGVAWAVSDAFFHVQRPLRGLMGLALRVTKTAPGLRIGSTFLWRGVSDRRAYRRWLEAQLEADRPRLLIPGHGEVIDDEALPLRLAELAAKRL